jgi:hypothetical protein
MVFGYFIKINELRPKDKPCVVKTPQNTSFGVSICTDFPSRSSKPGKNLRQATSIRTQRLCPFGPALRMAD